MQGMAIFVVVLGLSMALAAQQDALYIVFSVAVGGVIGSLLKIEERLDSFAVRVGSLLGDRGGDTGQAFVFATLVFCVGSMAFLGGIQSGLGGSNSILYLKSVLDGFSAIVFTSTMGAGVGLAAVPVLLYEGLIAAFAHFFRADLRSASVMADVTAVGGVLIVGIGINILEIKRIRVGDLLPGMIVVVFIKLLVHTARQLWLHF